MSSGYCKSWDNKELDILNAIKFFQMFLILITCTASYLILSDALNPWSMNTFSTIIMFPLIIGGVIASDIFFLVSAFLGFYRASQIYDAMNGLGVKDILKIYGKRLMRILPMFYLVFLFGFYAIPLIGTGPLWFMMDKALWKNCDQYWWANMLLVGNFIPSEQNSKGGCMQWSWPIACEFQLSLLIPFYVILYKKSRISGIIFGWLVVIAGTITFIVISD